MRNSHARYGSVWRTSLASRWARRFVVATVPVLISPTFAPAETPVENALTFHLDQADIEAGRFDTETLLAAGRHIFTARFTNADGAGRPGATGSGLPTRRPLVDARPFLRTSGPDSNSCAGCHNQPIVGGGGEFVANVFVGAQEREPVLLSVSQAFSAERGTTELQGAGLIELLAREMTADLHRIRRATVAEATTLRRPVRRPLVTKDVSFGFVKGLPSGEVDCTEVVGVDKDLVVRPWSQKGVVTSLRTFAITAMNHHHGMQANERYGLRRTGSRDFDRDNVPEELTEGDVTALVLFQASLPPPRRVVPPQRADLVARGEQAFLDAGCDACHRPALVLDKPVFTEPGPYNLEGTLRVEDTQAPAHLDLRELPWGGDLERAPNGGIIVRAFTDLKRHRIADATMPFFANEVVSQGFAPTDEFITRRLWAAGNSGPYGHRGDVTTLNEVIRYHGGEAKAARLRYEALDPANRGAIIEFLRGLRIVPGPQPHDQALDPRDDRVLAPVQAAWSEQVERRSLVRRELVGRARAAAERAERSAARSRLFALRAEHEGARAGALPIVLVETTGAPSLTAEIGPIKASLAPLGSDLDAVVAAAVAAERAVSEARAASSRAVAAATFAHPGTIDVPVGHLQAESVAGELRRLVSAEPSSVIAVLSLLVEWCEDLSFRAEQLTQQAGLAATRAEAEAQRLVKER